MTPKLNDADEPRFAHAPLLPWAVGMMLGIALESRFPCHPAHCAIAVLTCALLAFFRPLRTKLALLLIMVAAMSLGAMRHHLAMRSIDPNHITHFASNERSLARITGIVIKPPRIYRTGYEPFAPWLHTTDRTLLTIETSRIDVGGSGESVTGLLQISVSQPMLNVQTGDQIEAIGWLRSLTPPRNPAQFDWALYNARHRIRTRLKCPRVENIKILQTGHGESRTLRNRFRAMLLGSGIAAGDDSSSLLDTMVLGHRSAVDEKIERLFLDTGCAHYLAVSGVHIAMLASIVWFPARILGANRQLAAAMLITSVLAYVAVADARPSMLRAAVMACAYSFALLLRRRGNPLNTLAFAGLLLLAANPVSLFDIGFQLSFVAVTGIVLFTPALVQISRNLTPRWVYQRPPPSPPTDASTIVITDQSWTSWRNRAIQHFTLLGCVSIAAWMSTLPVVAIHFARVTPLGWLNSIIAFPFVFCVMTLSFIKLGVGLLLPFASSWMGAPLNLSTDLLRRVLEMTQDMFGQPISTSTPTVLAVISYYACLILIAFCVLRGWNLRSAGLVLLLIGTTIVSWCWPAHRSAGITITQLAVGRGTATVVELPDGTAWLYDAGSSSTSDPGELVILPLLEDRGITRLSGGIITHPNLDHFGGLPSVLRNRTCEAIYVNTDVEPDPQGRNTPFDELLTVLGRTSQNVQPLHASDALDWGPSVKVEVLWPPQETIFELSPNDQSIVIRMEYENQSVLMTGDIGFLPQKWLIENRNLKSDILVLPHHGAVVENTAAFIQAVDPKYLVRSSFRRNTESPALQQAAGTIPIYNTSDHGAIEIRIQGGKLSINGFVR